MNKIIFNSRQELIYVGKLFLFNFIFYVSSSYLFSEKIESVEDMIWRNKLNKAIENSKYFSGISDKNNSESPINDQKKFTQFNKAYIKENNLEYLLRLSERKF